MGCADTGRDPQYIDALNVYGWCPTPAPTGCVWFELPWTGKQAITAEGAAAVNAEANKQKANTFQDYQQLFLLLDQYRCNSGFFVRNIDDGSLQPWTPTVGVPGTPTDEGGVIAPPVSGNGNVSNITPTAGSGMGATPQPAPAMPAQQLVSTPAAATEGIIEQGFDAVTRAVFFVVIGVLLFAYLSNR